MQVYSKEYYKIMLVNKAAYGQSYSLYEGGYRVKEVVIIGGGASGLVAAIVAARRGAKVCLLERLSRVGKKILVTGNGRCNITNTQLKANCYHTSSEVYPIMGPIERFGYEETKTFFEELGIAFLVEGQKVYPCSEQATSVLDVLRMEAERLQVEILTDVKVTDLFYKKDGWQIVGEQGQTYASKKVIVATGGMANASLGCDGTGYNLLKRLGHQITPTFPILVHMLSSSPYCKMMMGTKVKADVKIEVEGKVMREDYGEVLFTEDGLSGPPIFQLSRIASRAKLEKQSAKVVIDLFKDISYDEMVSLLYERIARHPERSIEELFIGLLHKRIIVPVLKAATIVQIGRPCENLEYDEIARIATTLKGFTFPVEGTRGYKYAQVTAGGVKIEEVDLSTMGSLKAKDLYITGEVLDVDGDCGGYNLQWAWSTGFIAGESVSRNGVKA